MSSIVKPTLKRLNAITDREQLIEELAKETGRTSREVRKHLDDVRFERVALRVCLGIFLLFPVIEFCADGVEVFTDIHEFAIDLILWAIIPAMLLGFAYTRRFLTF